MDDYCLCAGGYRTHRMVFRLLQRYQTERERMKLLNKRCSAVSPFTCNAHWHIQCEKQEGHKEEHTVLLCWNQSCETCNSSYHVTAEHKKRLVPWWDQ